jgi:hypothetical protein
VQAVEAVTSRLRASLGASFTSFLTVDFSGRALVRLAHTVAGDSSHQEDSVGADRRDLRESASILPFDGVPAEQALRSAAGAGDRLAQGAGGGLGGVRRPRADRRRGDLDGAGAGHRARRGPGAPGVGPTPAAGRRHRRGHPARSTRPEVRGDREPSTHRPVRVGPAQPSPFSLAAEIQCRLLPASFTRAAGAFTLAAWLEPAATVGGDTFDSAWRETCCTCRRLRRWDTRRHAGRGHRPARPGAVRRHRDAGRQPDQQLSGRPADGRRAARSFGAKMSPAPSRRRPRGAGSGDARQAVTRAHGVCESKAPWVAHNDMNEPGRWRGTCSLDSQWSTEVSRRSG